MTIKSKLNVDALRAKMATLNGEKKNSQFWYPEVGNYIIRVLAWPEEKTSDGVPFIERYFYYNINDRPILAPKQFGDEDPVDELCRELWKSKKPEDKEAAKKLMPRMKAYMPVLVKGEEEKGVQLWAFNKDVYNRLIELMMKEDIQDFTDPDDGFNLEISVKNTDKKFNGKSVTAMSIDAARKQSALVSWFGGDKEKMTEVTAKLPDVDAIFPRKSTAEVKRLLNAWVNAGEEENTDNTAGTSRGEKVSDKLDELQNSLNAKKEEKEPAPAKQKKKVTLDDLEEETVPKKANSKLDDAFADLEDN